MGVLQRECKNTGYTRRKPGQVIFGQEFDSPQLHQSRASTRKSRSGFLLYYGFALAFMAGIFFVNASHVAASCISLAAAFLLQFLLIKFH